jgi:hypothetical protein
MIQHLLHKEIDKKIWDNCIDKSINKLPYAYSWWLDAVSPDWEALIEDDFKAVMPLTCKSKFGFPYLYQPFFTQQLGIFSPDTITADELNYFLDAIPSCYRYIDIQLNYANNPTNKDFQYTIRKNFTLDLTLPYIQLAANYHRNCRRNIQKALHSGFRVKQGPGPSVFTRFVYRHLDKQLTDLRKNFYPVLYKISAESIQNETGKIAGIYKPDGELVAAGWFVQSAGRCIFLVCASTPTGKKNQAMFMLVDHIIREKAGSGLIYDFSGSNIPGVAYFNQGFGASQNNYISVKKNLLPWPLNILKK